MLGVSARRLRLIHALIRQCQERSYGSVGRLDLGQRGSTDTRGHARAPASDTQRQRFNRAPNPFGKSSDLVAIGGPSEDHELVAADASENVLDADEAEEHRRDETEGSITSKVPEAIVDLFHVVQVQHQNGGVTARTPGVSNLGNHPVGKVVAIEHSCERIANGRLVELSLQRLLDGVEHRKAHAEVRAEPYLIPIGKRRETNSL